MRSSMTKTLLAIAVLGCLGAALAHGQDPIAITPQQAEFFEKRIRPVLADNCFSCHGPKKQQSGLRLDSLAGVLKGTEEGPVVVKGHPEKNPLIRALQHKGDVKMPPKGKLPAQGIAD